MSMLSIGYLLILCISIFCANFIKCCDFDAMLGQYIFQFPLCGEHYQEFGYCSNYSNGSNGSYVNTHYQSTMQIHIVYH